MAKKKLPLVAICGRPNVGKSTIFNRLIGKQRAIVHDQEGITRDRFYNDTEYQGHRFRVVDTGGMMENPIDAIGQKMQEQVREALKEAAVVVFVVDGQHELTRIDEQVRDELFKLGKPVVLAVNKLDNAALELNKFDFYSLGFGDPIALSATHGLGTVELLQAITAHLPKNAPEKEEEPGDEEEPVTPATTRVAIIGKPNVGKSSFINAILNEPRVIVDDTPGTTRDAIDIEFRWKGREYLLIDTAGLRRKAGISERVEHFSVARSLRAIRRADVCLVMMDATEGLTEQDKRIIGYCIEQGTAFILVYTKWDLVEDKERRFKELPEELDFRMAQVKYAPIITISNVTRQRLFQVFEVVDEVAESAERRVSTSEFNELIAEIKLKHNPPSTRGKRAKIKYGTQASVKPTTFVLFVNDKSLFHFSYVRFIENQIREKYGYKGVPLKIELREGAKRHES